MSFIFIELAYILLAANFPEHPAISKYIVMDINSTLAFSLGINYLHIFFIHLQIFQSRDINYLGNRPHSIHHSKI